MGYALRVDSRHTAISFSVSELGPNHNPCSDQTPRRTRPSTNYTPVMFCDCILHSCDLSTCRYINTWARNQTHFFSSSFVFPATISVLRSIFCHDDTHTHRNSQSENNILHTVMAGNKLNSVRDNHLTTPQIYLMIPLCGCRPPGCKPLHEPVFIVLCSTVRIQEISILHCFVLTGNDKRCLLTSVKFGMAYEFGF